MINYTRSNALAELDTLTPSVIHRAGKPWLLDRCAAIGITRVKRDGTTVLLKDARKADIADALIAELKAPRESLPEVTALLAVSPDEMTLLDSPQGLWDKAQDVATHYYNFLKTLTVAQYDSATQIWNAPGVGLTTATTQLAVTLSTLQRIDDGGDMAVESKLAFRRDVFKALDALVSKTYREYFHAHLVDNVTQLRSSVMQGMEALAQQKKANDRKRLNERKEDVFTLDPTEMLVLSAATLMTLDDDSPASDWKAVSFALAVATGRRMAEIHHSATFTASDSHTLHFTGQAKTKGATASKADDGFAIPTLVDATLCVNALAWLTKKGKRVASAEMVNTRYSKALSEYAKTWYKSAPTMLSEDATRDKSRCTYHRLRQIYGLCAVRAYRPANLQDTRYLGDILGHEQNASVSDRYTADLRIAEGAIVTV